MLRITERKIIARLAIMDERLRDYYDYFKTLAVSKEAAIILVISESSSSTMEVL
jgi:hypothetical protein